jgi:hypothetical protein
VAEHDLQARRPTRSISRIRNSVRWMVCSVSERMTQSKEPSANSDRPLSRSTCSTLTSFATQASTLSSSISTP